MRVTESTMAALTMTSLQRIKERLMDLQQQVSTQAKVSKPGDDPLTAQQILDLEVQLNEGEQYTKNISTADSFLSIEESALSGMGDSLTRIKEIAVAMSNSTYSAEDRLNAMAEVKQLKEHLIALGNTEINGRYVFSGFMNDTPPFDSSGAYNGDDADISIKIDSSNSVVLNYSGGELLRGTGGGTDVIGSIDNLITALGSNDVTGIQNTLTSLDESRNQVLSVRTDIGARMNRLEAAGNLIESTKVYLQKVISGKQDIDFTEAISNLTQQQTAYQAALMSTAKISELSLLNYL